MEKKNNSLDIFGLGEYGAALKIAVEKGFAGAEAILSRICLPAAEEFGQLVKDRVRLWRLNNAIKVIQKAGDKISFGEDGFKLEAHPKVVLGIIEGSSLEEDENLQNMWAGLLAATALQQNAKNDTNILFVEILKKLTINQATIINFICTNCKKVKDENGLFWAEHIELSENEIYQITGSTDFYRIDAELDQLVNMGLIQGGSLTDQHGAGFCFNYGKRAAQLEPSALALNLFVKCHGYNGSVIDFFPITQIAPPPQQVQILASKGE